MVDLHRIEFDVVTVDAQGRECDYPSGEQQSCCQRYSARCQVEDLGENIKLEMVQIPAGEYVMGAPATEEGYSPAQAPLHRVRLNSFFISRYPITQAQWQAVALLAKVNRFLDPDPACIKGANRPVEQVSWYDAVEFCDRLTQYTTRPYRLPSEAEWEYACRAETTTPFHVGDTITTELANYSGVDWDYMGKIHSRGSYGSGPKGVDRRETTNVGQFGVANRFGLLDMHGNVREWCFDCWHSSYENAPIDGSAWITGGESDQRVLRGGSWNTGPAACRSAFRTRFEAEAGLYDIGFRVAYA